MRIGRRRFLAPSAIGLVLATLSPWPSAAERPDRGYLARACGFDLDDDGIVGEATDDCRICDGSTVDPDGDGVAEDFLYVDADSGSDTSGDGSPGNPYRTIQHAWSLADGPEDGAEDVICLRGTTMEENIFPHVSGVADVRIKPREGSEARHFELPRDPAMLIGWDRDGDGCYPPYDDGVRDVEGCGSVADVAVLDGAGLDRAFVLGTGHQGSRFLEIAHLAARDYGYQTSSGHDIGFVDFGNSQPETSHIYLHDLELDNINRGKLTESDAITFDFFNGEAMRFSWVAIVNVAARNTGAYFARGDFGGIGIEGPLRFQNISYTGFGCGATCSDSAVFGFKLWGLLDGLEIIDSVFDSNADAWEPRPNGPTVAVNANACSRDVTVRNNHFHNWVTALSAKGSDGGCEPGTRPTDDVLFDSNIVTADSELFVFGVRGLALGRDGSVAPERSLEDVTAVNNVFYSSVGWRHCFYSEAGNVQAPGAGTVVFSGNTCFGALTFETDGMIQLLAGSLAFPLPRFRIENNILASPNTGDRAMIFEFQPSSELVVDRNVFDPMASYDWLGTVLADLNGWQATSGLDGHSRACVPDFADLATGELHLRDSDTCAQDVGGDIAAWTAVDIDGEPRRPGDGLEAGADALTTIFADGFESGDFSMWSSAVPSASGGNPAGGRGSANGGGAFDPGRWGPSRCRLKGCSEVADVRDKKR